MNEEIKEIKITDIFSDKYIIPIYQRKYSWTEKEIEQLLEDIIYNENNKYFLGTLTVDKKDDGSYEVIDGQQRLTTLCLIMICLNKHIDDLNINIDNMPSFEARQIYDNALNALKNMKENEEISAYDNVKEIYEGYKCIESYFKSNTSNQQTFLKNIEKTFLVRVQVPENTDLNHYFEIMNTRGEQLELHHIAKAKFLEAINDSNDKRTASIIWDACSQMNRYVQMSFKPEIRKKLFEEDLSDFKEDVLHWDTLKSIFNTTADNEDIKTLKDIIDGNFDKQVNENKDKNNTDEKPERFESIITFPYFLLHLNAVMQDSSEEDSLYDDKKLLINLAEHYENKDKESATKFISNMLKCRFLFDKYIVKRDYQDDDNNLKLSLLKYKDGSKPYLVNTYGKEEDESTQEPLKILQSLLRITYTSPRNMRWITALLKHLFNGKDAGLESVINVLENHCIEKIKKFYVCETKEFTEEDFNKQTGFNIERIVFTYLDYLLYRDGYKGIIEPKFPNWKVQFRNSVEHFFPQNPNGEKNWENEYLDCFGNLALVTVSGNSKFSNLNPKAKVEQYKDKDIIQQNPKLKIMAKITEMEGWTEEKAKEHQKEMFKILSQEINGKNSNI